MLKGSTFFVISAAIVVSVLATNGGEKRETNGKCGDNVEWSLTDTGTLSKTLTISGRGEMYDYYSPKAPWYDDREYITKIVIEEGVTSVGEFAFQDLKQATSVTFPATTLTLLGRAAFLNCYRLNGVTIPSSVSTIEMQCFEDCQGLAEIKIPDKVTVLENSVFWGCNSLKKVVFPKNLQSIKLGSFSYCSSLESLEFPDSLTSIGDTAFEGCNSLKEVTFPERLRSIEKEAFAKCKNLKTVTLNGDQLTVTGSFKQCPNLTTLIIGDNVKSITDSAFYNCAKLKEITFGGLSTIGYSTFHSCKGLTAITIGNNVTSIDGSAFEQCENLKTVTLGSRVKSIADTAFLECPLLSSFSVSKSNEHFSTDGGVLFEQNSSVIVFYPIGKTGAKYSVPAAVKSIRGYSFYGSQKLETVVIPDTVSSIGRSAFSGCTKLKDLNIPSGLKVINSDAFRDTAITNAVIPDGVTSIGSMAFCGCKALKSVYIPNSVNEIVNYAFSSCTSLESVTIPNLETFDTRAFEFCTQLKSVFYQGYIIPAEERQFYGCSSLELVCVSPEYEGNSFCGVSVSTSSKCKSFTNLFDQCFEGLYKDGKYTQQLRRNATEWIKKSNPCKKYECGADGPTVKDLIICNKGGACYEVDGVCNETNGKCEYDRSQKWYELKDQVNECNDVVCNGTTWIVQRRDNATDWEILSDNCREFQCDSFGPLAWSTCNSTVEDSKMCMNDECVELKTKKHGKVAVEIVFYSRDVTVVRMNMTDVLEIIREVSGVSIDPVNIGWESDEEGFINRVILFVDGNEAANTVVSSINSISKGWSCQYGVLCESRYVSIIPNDDPSYIAAAASVMMAKMLLLFAIVISISF